MKNLLTPSDNFQAVRDGRTSMPFYLDVDLTTARVDSAGTALMLNAAGNSFYIDANPSDGNCFVEFQDYSSDNASVNLYCSPGVIFNLPFTQLKLVNSAQPGKKVRVVYGVDVNFQPGSVAQIAITSAGGFTAVRPEAPTGFFNDTTAISANTPLTIFTPASNVNGAIILMAASSMETSVVFSGGFVAKTSPPAAITDGEMICAILGTSTAAAFRAGADQVG